MTHKAIEPVLTYRAQQKKWQTEFETAREALVAAEAELAEYQAEVNAFRMHCRLKLDDLVDELLALNVEKQACLTQLQLLRQEQAPVAMADEADPLRPLPDDHAVDELEPDLLLPTDVPHDKIAEKRLYRELARRCHPRVLGPQIKCVTGAEPAIAVLVDGVAGDLGARRRAVGLQRRPGHQAAHHDPYDRDRSNREPGNRWILHASMLQKNPCPVCDTRSLGVALSFRDPQLATLAQNDKRQTHKEWSALVAPTSRRRGGARCRRDART